MAASAPRAHTAKMNSTPTGASQGTLGGKRKFAVPRGMGAPGDEMYLWALVLAEVGLIAWGRQIFRRRHGG